MPAIAKLKIKPPKPTLEDRVIALMAELDEALDALAEARRPKGALTTDAQGQPSIVGSIPQTTIRRMLDAKGFGDCKCNSYLAATKES